MSGAIKVHDHESKEIYILGDLDCHLLSNRSNRPTVLLNLLSELYQLEQLITEPTKCTINTTILIDVTFTNCPNKVAASGVLHLSISDHSLVYVIRNVAIPSKNTHKVINVKHFHVNGFKHDLTKLKWSNINSLGSCKDHRKLWKKMFLSVVDKHAPFKRKRIRNKQSLDHSSVITLLNGNKLKTATVVSNDPND